MRRLLNSTPTPIAAPCLSQRNDGITVPFFSQIFGIGDRILFSSKTNRQIGQSDRAVVIQVFGQAGGIG